MTIKAIKEPPARSVCHYPEAIWLCVERWKHEDSEVKAGMVAAISLMFERDIETVQADLERGHV